MYRLSVLFEVLSGSADETLRFWKIFSASDKKAASPPDNAMRQRAPRGKTHCYFSPLCIARSVFGDLKRNEYSIYLL